MTELEKTKKGLELTEAVLKFEQDRVKALKKENKALKQQLTLAGVIVSLPPYGKCDCIDPFKCCRICHDLIKRSGNAL